MLFRCHGLEVAPEFTAPALYRQDPGGSPAIMAQGLELPREEAEAMARG